MILTESRWLDACHPLILEGRKTAMAPALEHVSQSSSSLSSVLSLTVEEGEPGSIRLDPPAWKSDDTKPARNHYFYPC